MVARRAFTKRKCSLCEHQVSAVASSGSLAAGSDLLVLSWQMCFVQHVSIRAMTLMLSLALFSLLFAVLDDTGL